MKAFSCSFSLKRWVLLTIACLQVFALSGILQGWSAIVPRLEDESEFGLSKSICSNMFTYAQSTQMLSCVLLGYLQDRFGPRLCSLICMASGAAGFVMFGASSRSRFDAFVPGLLLIGLGGQGAQNCVMHVSNLFERRSLVVSVISAFAQLGFLVFLALANLNQRGGISLHDVFIGYGVFVALLASLSFAWPDDIFRQPLRCDSAGSSMDSSRRQQLLAAPLTVCAADDLEATATDDDDNEDNGQDTKRMRSHLPEIPQIVGDGQTDSQPIKSNERSENIPLLWDQIRSIEFAEILAFFVFIYFWIIFYISSLDRRLDRIYSKSKKEDMLTVFNAMSPAGIALTPLTGWLMDTRHGFSLALLATTSLVLAFAALCFVETDGGVVSSFVLLIAVRTFLLNVTLSRLPQAFGFRHFGLLLGITLAIGGLCFLSQVLLHDSDLHLLNYAQLLSLIILALFLLSTRIAILHRPSRKSDGAGAVTSVANGQLNLRRFVTTWFR